MKEAVERLLATRRSEDTTLARFLEYQAAAQSLSGRPDGLAAARRLDSLALEGCCATFANLVAAWALRENGDLPAALRAVRRGRWVEAPDMLSAYLREEARLALVTGDTTGALRALRHFVALSDGAEPARRATVDSIGELIAHLGGPRP